MRHYVAVQAENGRWFYANEGISRITGLAGWAPAGACGTIMTCPACKGEAFHNSEARPCATCADKGAVTNPAPCPGHDTADEAYAHQKEHMLERSLRFDEDRANPRTMHRCDAADCTTMTSGGARVGGYFHKHLCAAHRNRETVATLYRVGENWES